MNDYLDTFEMAETAHTVPETVRYWRHIGYGPPSFKIGRRVLYRREDVQRWLDDEFARQNSGGAA